MAESPGGAGGGGGDDSGGHGWWKWMIVLGIGKFMEFCWILVMDQSTRRHGLGFGQRRGDDGGVLRWWWRWQGLERRWPIL